MVDLLSSTLDLLVERINEDPHLLPCYELELVYRKGENVSYYPACAHAQQGVKQSVCLSSVVCCLLSVRTKIDKSQHLGKNRINKWDKMM